LKKYLLGKFMLRFT